MGYRVVVRDKDLNRIGEIDTWISLDFVVEHCQQGSWQLLIKAGTDQAELLQQDGGIAIYQDGVAKPVMTGSIDTIQKWWTVEQHSSEGSVYVGGKTDTAMAFTRLAFPNPTKTVAEQYTATSTRPVRSPSGRQIWTELYRSLGSGALADRRIPGFQEGTQPLFGFVTPDTVRYDVIGEKILEWTKRNDAGYRILWNPDTKSMDLDVYAPRDLTKTVRFSPELGNLRQYTWTLTAPTATRVIVACQGEGKERYIWQKIDSTRETEWNRVIEFFVDRRDVPLKTASSGLPALVTTTSEDGIEDIGMNPDGGEWTTDLATKRAAYNAAVESGTGVAAAFAALVAAINAAKPTAVAYWVDVISDAADTALKDNEGKGNFQIYPIDTPQCLFGRDYFVGDLVTVAVDGEEYSDIVRSVSITVDDGGNSLTVSPVIGEQGSGDPLNLYATIFEMRKKLRKLEARM